MSNTYHSDGITVSVTRTIKYKNTVDTIIEKAFTVTEINGVENLAGTPAWLTNNGLASVVDGEFTIYTHTIELDIAGLQSNSIEEFKYFLQVGDNVTPDISKTFTVDVILTLQDPHSLYFGNENAGYWDGTGLYRIPLPYDGQDPFKIANNYITSQSFPPLTPIPGQPKIIPWFHAVFDANNGTEDFSSWQNNSAYTGFVIDTNLDKLYYANKSTKEIRRRNWADGTNDELVCSFVAGQVYSVGIDLVNQRILVADYSPMAYKEFNMSDGSLIQDYGNLGITYTFSGTIFWDETNLSWILAGRSSQQGPIYVTVFDRSTPVNLNPGIGYIYPTRVGFDTNNSVIYVQGEGAGKPIAKVDIAAQTTEIIWYPGIELYTIGVHNL